MAGWHGGSGGTCFPAADEGAVYMHVQHLCIWPIKHLMVPTAVAVSVRTLKPEECLILVDRLYFCNLVQNFINSVLNFINLVLN